MIRNILLLLISVLMVGCSIEHPSDELVDASRDSEIFSLSEAKILFESSFSDMEAAPDGFLSPGDFTPQWSDAYYSEMSDRMYYDVPIFPTYKYKVLNSSFVRGRSVVSRDDVCQRLVVMRKSESATGVYVASFIPAADNKVSISGLSTYQIMRSCYSGMLLYTDVSSGRIVRVNAYESGHKVYGVYVPAVLSNGDSCSALTDRLSSLSLSRYVSVLTKYDGGEIDPSYCYPDPEPDPEDPFDGFPYDEEYPPYEYPYDDNFPEDPEPDVDDYIDYGQGSGNQGISAGTPPVSPPPSIPPYVNGFGDYPYTPKSTDKLARPNIPSKSDIQVPGWCVHASMSYISVIFGADYKQLDYRNKYIELYGNDSGGYDGVSSSNLNYYVHTCFNASWCSSRASIFDALDSGDVVLVYVSVSEGMAHAVTIIGYADDRTFIYMDTENGLLYNEDAGNLLDIIAGYSISGYKKL